MKKFWTSDTHFNQERTFKYSMRSMYFKNLDEMNTKTEGKSIVQSLVTGVDNGERSFKVYISPPQGSSYARDIAKKYGVTFEQIKLNIDKT